MGAVELYDGGADGCTHRFFYADCRVLHRVNHLHIGGHLDADVVLSEIDTVGIRHPIKLIGNRVLESRFSKGDDLQSLLLGKERT